MNTIYQWIDRAWQWVAERVFVRFDFDLPADALKHMATSGRLTFCLTHGGIVEWLILSSWSRQHNLGAVLVANRKRILLFSKPLYFLQILFRHKKYSDLFLSSETGPRLLFCPSREPKRPFDPTPSENVLAGIYKELAPTGTLTSFHLVPVLILWRKYVRGAKRRPFEYLLGLSSRPNLLGKTYYLLRQRRDSTVRALDPLDMHSSATDTTEMLEASEAIRVAKATRRKILVLTQQEMRIILGPRYDSPNLVKESILRDPEIKATIDRLSKVEGIDPKKVMQRAYKDLTEIVANYKVRTVEVLYVFLRWLFTKVFDGVIYSAEEIEVVREVMRKRAVVFIPCHRSHFDYLVMPYVLFDNDIVTPHIAAGVNLSFWPVGTILRSAGAFFIRRSFRGDELYGLCLKKYIEYILKNRTPFKFFIEGTRSRSGKMLPPAFGILKTVLERFQNHIVEDIALIPVSITYDEVPEEGTYSQELGGKKKTEESTAALFKSRRVVKRKMGRVYLRFAPFLSVKEISDLSTERGETQTLMLQKTAFRVSKSICDVTPITPKAIVSTILLNHGVSTLSLEDILRLSSMVSSYLLWATIPMTVARDSEVKRAIEQIVRTQKRRGVIGSAEDTVPRLYFCEEPKRTLLNYYKNNAIHALVLPGIALLAAMKMASRHKEYNEEQLLDYAVELRNLLKFDFFFNPTLEFREEIAHLLEYFLPKNEGNGTRFSAIASTFEKLQDMTVYTASPGYLLESYLVALDAIKEIGSGTFEKKALIQSITRYAISLRERRELRFAESISIQNFSTAIQMLENYGFIHAEKTDVRTKFSIGAYDENIASLRDTLSGYLDLIDSEPQRVFDFGEIGHTDGPSGHELSP
ncbi:MAG: 1-acyl-sn-glycerol-3-phosphate acyltransferase [Bdellovibrionales bacterium]|nr:1-acyl-sn-glycerol-3-phosphate acyltransferase [Bdellovibrionales bacterium]